MGALCQKMPSPQGPVPLWGAPCAPVLGRTIAIHKPTWAMVSEASILLRSGVCSGLQPPNTATQSALQGVEGAQFVIPV